VHSLRIEPINRIAIELMANLCPPGSVDRHSRSPDRLLAHPGQNAYAERLIGSIRRECTDHIVIFGVRHLRHVLLLYMGYYNGTRTHLSLNKDAPDIARR